jgi:hypothetical protein
MYCMAGIVVLHWEGRVPVKALSSTFLQVHIIQSTSQPGSQLASCPYYSSAASQPASRKINVLD